MESLIPVAPLAQVQLTGENLGEPEVNYVIDVETRDIVVEPDIPRVPYYV